MHLASSSLPLPSLAVLSHFPMDWVIIVVFALVITFDALRSGVSRAAAMCLAWPAAILAFQLLPNTVFVGKALSPLTSPFAQAVLFLMLLVVFFALIYRTTHIFGSSNGFLLAFLAGISATVTTVALWVHEPVLQAVWHFGPQIQSIFGSAYTALWLLLAFVLLVFVRS